MASNFVVVNCFHQRNEDNIVTTCSFLFFSDELQLSKLTPPVVPITCSLFPIFFSYYLVHGLPLSGH